MGEAPPRKTLRSLSCGHAGRAGLERMVSPEATGQNAKAQLHMRQRVSAQRGGQMRSLVPPQKAPVVVCERPGLGQLNGRAQYAFRSSLERRQMRGEVMMRAGARRTEEDLRRLRRQRVAPKLVQSGCKAEDGLVLLPWHKERGLV